MNTTMTILLEQDYFSPASREAISTAQREAVRMNAKEVTPEHLFLGVLAHESDEVAEAFSSLRLNQAVLRKQALTLFPFHSDTGTEDSGNLPLSREAHTCLEWAIAFATYQNVAGVQLEHILLGSVRHQRLQPLLALFLINARSSLPSYVTERSGRTYTAIMDQHIFSRIRARIVHRVSNRILSSFERPIHLFSDIAGFHGAKQELQEVTGFLRNPQLVRRDMRASLYGLLLVGPAGTSRTLIGQAIAGEAGVPLLSLSLSTLVEMAHSLQSNSIDVVRSSSVLDQPEREMIAKRGRHIIHDLFEQGRKVSPCVLYISELDALARPEARDICDQWQSQLQSEMDGCNTHPVMAVVATVSQREQLDPSLIIPGRFDHTATLDGTVMKPFAIEFMLCTACQQQIPAQWKYCGFCGTTAARTCLQCGALRPEVKGVHFCPQCGANFKAREPGEASH